MSLARRAIHVPRDHQASAEARLLDVEIGAHERQLGAERRPLVLGLPQRVAEHLGELLHGAIGQIRIAMNEAGNRVERVEQEVRVDLRAQRLQARPTGEQLERLRALRLQRLALPQARSHHLVAADVGEDADERRDPR